MNVSVLVQVRADLAGPSALARKEIEDVHGLLVRSVSVAGMSMMDGESYFDVVVEVPIRDALLLSLDVRVNLNPQGKQ